MQSAVQNVGRGRVSPAFASSGGSEKGLKAGLETRLYFLTGSGAGVAQGVALKFASFGSRRNDVLV